MNLFKTVFLMSLLTGLFLVIGALIGGGPGMIIAFLFAQRPSVATMALGGHPVCASPATRG